MKGRGWNGSFEKKNERLAERVELLEALVKKLSATEGRDSVPKATWVFAIYEKWVLVKFMKPLGSFFV